MLIDTSPTMSDKVGLSALIGTNNKTSFCIPGLTGAQLATAVAVTGATTAISTSSPVVVQSPGDRSGMQISSVINTAQISTATAYTFCLPLLSGVVGINVSKMLCVGNLKNPIRLEIYLASNDDALYTGTAGSATGTAAGGGAVWQLVNCEFCACYVEIQDDSLEHIINPDETTYISTTTYRQSSSTLNANSSGEMTFLIPFRCASLTGIYSRFGQHSAVVQGVDASAAYRKSSSVNPNLSYYYWRIGSSMLPSKPIYLYNGSLCASGSEGFAELLKSFHALSASIGNSSITSNQYNVSQQANGGWALAYAPSSKLLQTAMDTSNNAFCIGLELQSFSNRSDSILSGISTLNAQVFFTAGIISGETSGGTNFTIDTFGQMDMILCIDENGIMSAKY